MDKMQPPSGFSFFGLAELLKEIRELIKDLDYRNKHEKLLCELERIEKSELIRSKVTQDDSVIDRICYQMQTEAEKHRQLKISKRSNFFDCLWKVFHKTSFESS